MPLLEASLWIGGERRSSSTGKAFDVVNSITQQIVTQASAASSQDVIDAIEAADRVQPAWEAVPWRVKRDLFIKATNLLKTKYVQRIITTTTAEIASLESWVIRDETFGAVSYLLEAVVDVTQLTRETKPIVLKSAELSPASNQILVRVLYEAGLSKGFTGSDRVRKILAGEAAKYFKPCIFEMGGKIPVVVLNDANVKKAARSILSSGMVHAGQVSTSTKRVIVQSSIAKEFIESATTLAKNIRVKGGDPHILALSSKDFVYRVLLLVKDAKDRSGEILVGDLTAHGAHVNPHIVLGVEPGWSLWEQESYGPVLAIKVVEMEEEAIKMANATDYSLSGAIWTSDMAKGLILGRQIRSGFVQVNGLTFPREPGIQVRGLEGESGYGLFDVEHLTQKRVLVLNSDAIPVPFLADLRDS
ncbi:hypothetical protein M422DRAFT_61635 [Sphaerobolus stellatus SS14]|nr:hypothetical protein M422DRAFT_61635 [Sphaerobolus stellatus SS14]